MAIKQDERPGHIESLARQVVDAAFKVHCELGPGLLESVYETCLLRELAKRSVAVRRQVPVPVVYDGETLDTAFKIDLLVGDAIVIEIKSVEKLVPIHQAQLLTYLRLANKTMGFLINFNVKLIKDGIRRFVL